jgi:hypothetical protein
MAHLFIEFGTTHREIAGLYQMSWGMSTVHVALKTTERNADTAIGH